MLPRLTWNSRLSCVSFLTAGIIDVSHHIWLNHFLVVSQFEKLSANWVIQPQILKYRRHLWRRFFNLFGKKNKVNFIKTHLAYHRHFHSPRLLLKKKECTPHNRWRLEQSTNGLCAPWRITSAPAPWHPLYLAKGLTWSRNCALPKNRHLASKKQGMGLTTQCGSEAQNYNEGSLCKLEESEDGNGSLGDRPDDCQAANPWRQLLHGIWVTLFMPLVMPK